MNFIPVECALTGRVFRLDEHTEDHTPLIAEECASVHPTRFISMSAYRECFVSSQDTEMTCPVCHQKLKSPARVLVWVFTENEKGSLVPLRLPGLPESPDPPSVASPGAEDCSLIAAPLSNHTKIPQKRKVSLSQLKRQNLNKIHASIKRFAHAAQLDREDPERRMFDFWTDTHSRFLHCFEN